MEESLTKEKLQELMNKYYKKEDTSLSFFDIINKSHDENLISLMIRYLFENDSECLKNVLNKAYKDNIHYLEIIEITPEYSIKDKKRIDILIKALIDKKESIIVIENKVYSKEHGEQCKLYYEYIDKEFPNFIKYYLFLKPEYNKATSGCKKFMVINYRDLCDSITNEDDIYIKDFKKTINNNLVVGKMDELKKYILDHFSELYGLVSDLDKQLSNFLENEYGKEMQEFLKCERVEVYKPNYSIRFYNANCWGGYNVSNDEKYYFYVELVGHDKNIKYPKFQYIINRYSDNPETKISKYVINKDRDSRFGKNCFVIRTVSFISDKDVLSPEWKRELIEKSKEVLKPFYDQMLEDVKNFLGEK
ncbi:MAG: PD-(D/E)XK nuclease family protein [Acholeplasmatales bacterium]|nr:PD-(D/E)XK nuclease family protein [Acholeplasmatales bacterium]